MTELSETEKFFIAALAKADRMEAMFKEEFPHVTHLPDDGLKLLNEVAFHLELDHKDPAVRSGIALACRFLWELGQRHACCPSHGEHLCGVTDLLATTVARA